MDMWEKYRGRIKCPQCQMWVIPQNGYCSNCECDIQNYVVGYPMETVCTAGSTVEEAAQVGALIYYYRKYKNLE